MNIITQLQSFHNQIKIHHWQTNSYAEHQALGKLYDTFNDLIDTFVETYMGKYGRISREKGFVFTAENYSDLSTLKILDEQAIYLIKDLPQMLKTTDTDLLNIRDEMLGAINKTKYLLSLK